MTTLQTSKLTQKLQLIVEALNNIDCKYFTEEITRLHAGVIVRTGQLRANESTFVTQLVSKIEGAFSAHSIHLDKYFQTDQPKQLIFRNDKTTAKYGFTFSKLFNPSEDDFFKVPDIVIHAGPNDFDKQNQIFLSEVKTEVSLSQRKFDIDLFKVNVYHEQLKFQNSAFIIANNDVEFIKRRLTSYERSKYYLTGLPELYLIVRPSCNTKAVVISTN